MSLNNCTISFDNHPDPVFYSGETVSGTVHLTLNKNKICQALMLKVSGMSKCRWSESRGTGKQRRTIYFHGKEIYIETYNNLMADQHIQTGSSDLLEGKHTFRFTFILPPNLPTSLEGYYGYTRYAIKITMKRSFKIDLSYTMCFTVLSLTNLNSIPNAQLPVINESCKNFYLVFIPKGTLYMTVQVPCTGFVPGQPIFIRCILKNESSVKVRAIKFVLKKKTLFTCTHPYTNRRIMTDTFPLGLLNDITKSKEYTGETTVHIPPLPPSTLTLSSIIDVSYSLEITAEVSGMHVNLSSKIPVVIGTIPIYGQISIQDQPGTSSLQPSAPTMDSSDLPPSAPPMNYSDLPPPSYEAVMQQKNEKMMDDNEEDWNVTDPYLPKYPIYDFSGKKEK